MAHLLVTNDFPPKVGGIQSYLWELWRRLPPEDTTVLASAFAGDRAFDADQEVRIDRAPHEPMLPTAASRRRAQALAEEVDADIVMCDPAIPIGMIGPRLGRTYGVVLHRSEVTVPGRLPGSKRLLARVLDRAALVVAAGQYPAAEAERVARSQLPIEVIPPGVDVDRFRPLDPDEVVSARQTFALPVEGRLIVSVSRLVPRKGMDVLIQAAGELVGDRPDLTVAIAGEGRDGRRLRRMVESTGAPVRLLGRVDDDRLPLLYGCADVFAMICRNRWAGLEQEGFGIVFAEAAACGVPQVVGNSGGAADAVVHDKTGLIVDDPTDVGQVVAALGRLLDDPPLARRLGELGRQRVVDELDYDGLADQLRGALATIP